MTGGQQMRSSEIVELPEWQGLAPERLTGTVLVIGATDSGKSTLVRWLAARMVAAGGTVGWLDADIGQSTLGLPATMSLAIPDGEEDPPLPAATFFIGGTTPRGRMLPVLVGLFRLRERAVAAGATTVLIDTSGLVAATAGGGVLKEWKIELLRPATVIAIQLERELEHLLGPLRRRSDLRLHVLPVAPHVRRRSPEARSANRRRKFRDYFADAQPLRLALRSLPVYGLDRAAPGRLVGLLDREGFALAVGLLLEYRQGRMEILTPLRNVAGIAALRLGDLRVDAATGEEMV
jgi:polynucleotide 5'-hydroxyl-kinase GRC3/NOL9